VLLLRAKKVESIAFSKQYTSYKLAPAARKLKAIIECHTEEYSISTWCA